MPDDSQIFFLLGVRSAVEGRRRDWEPWSPQMAGTPCWNPGSAMGCLLESRNQEGALGKTLCWQNCAELCALAPEDNLPPSAGGLSKCSPRKGSSLLSLPPALSMFLREGQTPLRMGSVAQRWSRVVVRAGNTSMTPEQERKVGVT